MKKILVFQIFCLLTCSNFYAQVNKGFKIDGYIKGLSSGSYVYLIHEKENSPGLADTVSTVIATKNRFVFVGKLPLEGEFYFIKLDSLVSKQYLTVLLINSHIKIEGAVDNWSNAKVSGSVPNDDYNKLLRLVDISRKRLATLNNERNKIRSLVKEAGKNNDTVMMKIWEDSIKKLKGVIKQQNNTYYKIMIDFVFDNTSSLYTPNLALKIESLLGTDSLQELYNKLSLEAKMSFYGVKLNQSLFGIQNIKIGNKVPNFNFKTLDGNEISLSEVLGKNRLTLIDFWASWCKPCREETPKLLEVFTQFQNKGFNILSLSSDRSMEAWRKAIEEDGMSWIHGQSSQAVQIFDINALPAYILLDNEGKMIAFDCAATKLPSAKHSSLREGELYKKVAEILGKE